MQDLKPTRISPLPFPGELRSTRVSTLILGTLWNVSPGNTVTPSLPGGHVSEVMEGGCSTFPDSSGMRDPYSRTFIAGEWPVFLKRTSYSRLMMFPSKAKGRLMEKSAETQGRSEISS